MELIDLSRELYHRTQVHPSHPPAVVTVWYDHDEETEGRPAARAKISVKA